MKLLHRFLEIGRLHAQRRQLFPALGLRRIPGQAVPARGLRLRSKPCLALRPDQAPPGFRVGRIDFCGTPETVQSKVQVPVRQSGVSPADVRLNLLRIQAKRFGERLDSFGLGSDLLAQISQIREQVRRVGQCAHGQQHLCGGFPGLSLVQKERSETRVEVRRGNTSSQRRLVSGESFHFFPLRLKRGCKTEVRNRISGSRLQGRQEGPLRFFEAMVSPQ